MIRQTAVAITAALAALAAVCACTSTDIPTSAGDKTTMTKSTSTQSSTARTTSSPDGATDLSQIAEDTPLEPGRYSMELLFDDGPTRAVVDVPEGYVSFGSVIGSDDGDLAFWGEVTQVDTDPCHDGRHVAAGTSVRDLASLLVAQQHMRASEPVPVTIGGYHGLYLELTAPADLDRCRGGIVTIFAAGDTWLRDDVPNGTFNEWILDVHGQRVVGGARILPDAANRSELIGIVESAEFTIAD